MQVSAFSDSIVVSEVVRDEHIGVIRLVGYASYLWWKFLAKGVLTRGGLSVGDLRHKDGIIFGPAMNEAYELESQVATYPRIVLSNDLQRSLLQELVREHGGNHLMLQFQAASTRRDFDGVHHVHVLGHAAVTPPELCPAKEANPATGGTSFTTEELNQSKWAAIEKFLAVRPTSLRVASKYDWLASYLDDTKAHS